MSGRVILLTAFFAAMSMLTGCEEAKTANGQQGTDDSEMVSQHEQSKSSPKSEDYPEHLQGLWVCDKPAKWQIELQDKGDIVRLTVYSGIEIDMENKGAQIGDPDGEVYSYYIMGPMHWEYDREKNFLTVRIVTKEFYLRAQGQEIISEMEDTLSGPVAGGGTLWTPVWRNESTIIGVGVQPPAEKRLVFRKGEGLTAKPNIIRRRKSPGTQE